MNLDTKQDKLLNIATMQFIQMIVNEYTLTAYFGNKTTECLKQDDIN